MFDKRVTLETWLSEANRAAEHGVLTAVRVNHVIQSETGATQKGDEIIGRRFEQGKAWSAKEEAALILGKCQVYAQDLRGVQTFRLEAFYGQEEPSAFHHITATGRGIAQFGETEEASPRGMNAQGMRMADLVVGRAFQMMDRLWQVNEHQLSTLERERSHYQGQFREAETIIHTMLREKIAESHTQRMRELEFERASGERAKLITFLPALIRHITGDNSIIPAHVADSSVLETVSLTLRKMPRDQQESTLAQLAGLPGGAELVMVLGARLREIGARQEQEEEAARLFATTRTEEEKAQDRELALLALNGGADSGVGGAGGPPKLNS